MVANFVLVFIVVLLFLVLLQIYKKTILSKLYTCFL